MAWTGISFVNVGDEVTSTYMNELLANLHEDDVAKAEDVGDIIVASGANVGTRLTIGDEGDFLRSNLSLDIKMEWVASSSLSGDFVTWDSLKTYLGI